jgi:hypothetical protein
MEVAGEGVLCLGVRGGEAEPPVGVIAERVQATHGMLWSLTASLDPQPDPTGQHELIAHPPLPS